jgi:hypothetical protein
MKNCERAEKRSVFFSHGLNNDTRLVPVDTCGWIGVYCVELCGGEI